MRIGSFGLLVLLVLNACGPGSPPPPPADAAPSGPDARDAAAPMLDDGADAAPDDASSDVPLAQDVGALEAAPGDVPADAAPAVDAAPSSDALDDALDGGAPDAPAADASPFDALPDGLASPDAPFDATPADATADGPYMLPSPPVAVAPDPDAPYPADTLTPPDTRFDTMPATLTVGGVEIIDPAGVLAGAAVGVTARDPATLAPALAAAFAAWDITPSGPLGGVVYVRLPLPAPRTPGERVLLWTLDPDSAAPTWFTESVGRVTPDGARALVALQHFSPHALTLDTPVGAAFIAGADCTAIPIVPPDAGTDAGPSDASYLTTIDLPFAFNSAWPTASETDPSASAAPIDVAYSHDVGRGVLTRLTSDPRIAATVVFANNDPVPWDDEDAFGDPALVEPLARLGALVRDRSCGALTLRVTEAFDSRHEHSARALHYEGRALDLTLALAESPTAPASASAAAYSLGLSRLALLATEAGFAWVNNETSRLHVHVSMPRSAALSGASRAASVAPLRDHGVGGAVRTRGANGDATRAPGNGGAVAFHSIATWPGAASGPTVPFFTVAPGATATTIPAAVTAARILGTLALAADTSVVVNQSFYLAPGARITCPGCNLTITARGVTQIEGVIDLSATATSASRNGGALTVNQWRDGAPVFLLPSVDTRGGDGGDGGGTAGGMGGVVTIDATGDLVLGNDLGRGGLPALTRADHTAQGGTSWQVLAPTVTGAGVIVTSGGVGSASESLFAGSAGGAGGNGGALSVTVSNDALGLFGRATFYNAFLATGGTPGDATTSPLELFRFSDAARGVGPFVIGPGSAGGRGAQSFGSVAGGSGGVGGNAGALTLAVADRARACPAYDLATPFTVTGLDEYLTDLGTGMRASGPGACALAYSAVGGSGGANGGSGTGFPGRPGHHGTAATIALP